jgi:hypothetical protein
MTNPDGIKVESYTQRQTRHSACISILELKTLLFRECALSIPRFGVKWVFDSDDGLTVHWDETTPWEKNE